MAKKRPTFDDLVKEAMARIPSEFRAAMDRENVRVLVRDWPTPEMLEEVGLDADDGLYGLFTGLSLTERSLDDTGLLPPVIHLFRVALEEDFPDRRELVEEIEITLAHEIGHFMGFDEETLSRYGYE